MHPNNLLRAIGIALVVAAGASILSGLAGGDVTQVLPVFILTALGVVAGCFAYETLRVTEASAADRPERPDAHQPRSAQASPDAPPHAREPQEEDEVRISERENGHVKWFSGTKGYGFIIRDSGGEVFVHYRAIRGRHRSLPDGARVAYGVVQRKKGLQAEDVQLEGDDGEDEVVADSRWDEPS